MTAAELIGVVRGLMVEVGRLRAENEKLSQAMATLRVEKQALKDEIARAEASAAAAATQTLRDGEGDGSAGV